MSHTCNGVPCVPIRTEGTRTLIEYQDGVRTWVKADGVKTNVKVGDTVEWDASRDRAKWTEWHLQGWDRIREQGSDQVVEINHAGDSVLTKYNNGWWIPAACVTKVIRTPKFALGDRVKNTKTGAFAVITSQSTNHATGEVIFYNADQCMLLSLDDWEKWVPKFKVGDRVIQTAVGKECIVLGYDMTTGNVNLSGWHLSREEGLIPIPSVDMIPEAYSTTDGVRVSRDAKGRWRGAGTSDFSSPEAAITWMRYQKGGAK